jgi:hypothetical protein
MKAHRAEWMDAAFAAKLYELPLVAPGQAALAALEIELAEGVEALRKAAPERVAKIQGYLDGLERLKVLVEQAKKVTHENP